MNLLFRLLLTFNATSLLVIIFLVQKAYTLGYFFDDCTFLVGMHNMVSYGLYFTVPVIFTGVSIYLSRYLGKDDFKTGQVIDMEHANNSFLPSYLGYFFVALSIMNWETLFFVYGVLFVFTFLSQALYFNPLFLLFGFEFYNLKTKNGGAIFLISRHEYKTAEEIVIEESHRINNYTFIERR
ncbi:membrane protein [Pseudoalteromonas lipolytica SCSIO 04301]|uniref:hypothetical protein n=1 Tax=Pseudoalteromonas lipolytica TaxID=570156 RepID=UPI000445B885|nr:hypothetical protein [Pseudoalteromonas lipolytica]EWH04385.1 membrane protein [Pseudoalteromonas lipolytica SCSIO 04301]